MQVCTFQTLLKFLNWIPLGYIFETTLVKTLVYKFLPEPAFRNDVLACLTEIGSLDIGAPISPTHPYSDTGQPNIA